MRNLRTIGLLMVVTLVLIGVANAQEGGAPQTGTDRRDFANKFMPYYRYTEMENKLEQNELVLFGLIAIWSSSTIEFRCFSTARGWSTSIRSSRH